MWAQHQLQQSQGSDTALGSLSLLLVNPSSWALGAVSRDKHTSTEGWGEGRQEIRHSLLPRARMLQQTPDAAPSLHIFTPVIPGISQQSKKEGKQQSRDPSAGLYCLDLPWRDPLHIPPAQMSIPFGNSGFIKSSRQYVIIYPALTWMLSNKCAGTGTLLYSSALLTLLISKFNTLWN